MRGHPWIVANKGRLGFDADDLVAVRPRGPAAGAPAAGWPSRPDRADARTVDGLDHAAVVRRAGGRRRLDRLCAPAPRPPASTPTRAAYLPVHPWQWTQPHRARCTPATSPAGRIVPLGPGPRRVPAPAVASARWPTSTTPSGGTSSCRCRSSTPRCTGACPGPAPWPRPALTEWLLGRHRRPTPFLRRDGPGAAGRGGLGERRPPRLRGRSPGVPYQHTELLGAIWRESVAAAPGGRASGPSPWPPCCTATRGARRSSARVIARSGLDVDDWVAPPARGHPAAAGPRALPVRRSPSRPTPRTACWCCATTCPPAWW